METKSNLRRAQSLKSVPTEHALSWTEAGLRDRRKSVTQLVAQYQNSITRKSKTSGSEENKPKLVLQTAASDTGVKAESDSSVRLKARLGGASSTALTRSRSVETLPHHRNVSTSALRELYESKGAIETKSRRRTRNGHKPHNYPVRKDAAANYDATEDAATKDTLNTAVRGEPEDLIDYENPVTQLKAANGSPKLVLQTAASDTGVKAESDSSVRLRARLGGASSTALTRSRSVETLPHHRNVSTSALRELYESKGAMETKSRRQTRNGHKPHNYPVRKDAAANYDATEDAATKDTLNTAVRGEPEDLIDYENPVTQLKAVNGSPKMIRTPRTERRKTIAGDDKRKSVADFRTSGTLYGREKSPISVKAISALYLSKVATADLLGSLLKPEQNSTSPSRPKVSKMADSAQKDSEQHDSLYLKDEPESAEPKIAAPISPSSSQPNSQPPTPPPPVKEGISTLYQQRQKCELRRLLKHTCPEMKGLDNMVEEEFADILSTGIAPDTVYQGEVHSRCMIFENGAYNVGSTHLMKGTVQDGNILERPLTWSQEEESMAHSLCGSGQTKEQLIPYPQPDMSSQKDCEALGQEENFRVDVKATLKMFEGQLLDTLKDNMEDVLPGRVVVSEEEKGSVIKQKRDFEIYLNDTVKRNSPINIIDLSEITDQDAGEVYLGISRAKEIFEKGSHDKKNCSSASENISTVEETLKANVKNRAQMFETMPLDRINLQNETESSTTDEAISKSLTSLYNFNVIQSHGVLLEATEAAHVKKVNYIFTQDKGPEIEHEEVVMGSIKSILLQIFARVNLNSLIAFLKEDDQGNVEVKNVEVPTHQLPFTLHQDKEYRTTNMIQAIEDLLGQETCPGKGVLIQENGIGSVDTLVYTLFTQKSFNSTGINRQIENKTKEIKFSLSRNDAMPSPPPSIQDDASSLSGTSKGNLDYTKSLQKRSSDEDLSVPAEENEQNVIVPGSLKITKAMFTTNQDNVGSYVQSGKTVQQPSEDNMSANQRNKSHTKNETRITECENVKSGKILHCQDAKYMCNENPDKCMVIHTEPKNIEDDEFSNLHAAIVSLQQATEEAKALQLSMQEKQQDISQSKLMQEVIAVVSENQETSAAEGKGPTEEAECPESGETEQQQQGSEEAIKSSVQAALDSLEKSHFNVTKGDFKTAMIYRNSGKSYARQKKETDVEMGVKQAGGMVALSEENKCVLTQLPGQVNVEAQGLERAEARQGHLTNKLTACSPMTKQTHPQAPLHNSKKALGPKPIIPPKPDHLKVNINSTTMAIHGCAATSRDLNKMQAESNSVATPTQLGQQCAELTYPAQTDASLKASQDNANVEQFDTGCVLLNEGGTLKQQDRDPITVYSPEGTGEDKTDTKLEESQRNIPNNLQNLNESPVEFQSSVQNFGIKAGQATAPVKPKRIKMATSSTTQDLVQININDTNPKPHDSECEGHADINVKMRVKKVKGESETERRQRLSVHMDDIMRGNANAVMEIFDKLRKQEELQSILSKVEEMEGNTNQEHVSDLKKMFENVPHWVVSQERINSNNEMEKKKAGRSGTVCDSEMMSSMHVAFGDLEKASAAIINLKEQTLSRLVDIEETIKKALYSVSTLKCDSDIAGLSGLFKESMMDGHRSPVSGNIRKISIGSSKSSKAQSLNNLEVLRKTAGEITEIPEERSKPQLSIPTPKPRAGSPSSPSFISIHSAARKNSESPGLQKPPASVQKPSPRAFCGVTKEDSCSNDKRQVSTLEVQTIPEGETVIGTKTIREKYEETDRFGNTFYSSKTSTVVTTQPETKPCFRREVMSSPTTSEINTYPRINTPTLKRDQASL